MKQTLICLEKLGNRFNNVMGNINPDFRSLNSIFHNTDGPVKSMFSRKGAKNAKKISFNIK